jgi:hypothetical protein
MRSPFVRRNYHDQVVAALQQEANGANDAVAEARNEAAQWRLEYRKIRDYIVDVAVNPNTTPQVKAVLAPVTGMRP